MQLFLDVAAEIGLISITGGIESWFSFTLILTVLSSSIVLNKRAGYVIASLSSICYGVLLDLQFYRMLPIEYDGVMEEKQFLFNIFMHVISLYITAYLAGYLSYSLEKTVKKLEERDSNIKDLEFFNTKVIESLPSGLFTTDLNGSVLDLQPCRRIDFREKKRDCHRPIPSITPCRFLIFRLKAENMKTYWLPILTVKKLSD